MTSTEYTPEKLQRMLADVITNRFPLADVTLLLRAGADADGPVTRGLRPLHYAAYENAVEVAEVLIAEGADVNAADELGYTPLHVATKHGHVEAARCLLNYGAAVNYGFDDCDCNCPQSTRTGQYNTQIISPIGLTDVEYNDRRSPIGVSHGTSDRRIEIKML